MIMVWSPALSNPEPGREREPEPDYSTLQTDTVLQSAFDQAVSENLEQKEYDSCDPAQSCSASISEAEAATLAKITQEKTHCTQLGSVAILL